MSISSVVNDLVTSVSVINAQKPIPPTISGYSVGGVDDTALDPAGGQTVQINGTGFLVGATITFDGSAVAVVTYVNPNQLTFTSPAKSAGTYTIYVVNSDGGTAIYIPGIIYSVLPTWTTSAGTLGSYYETTSISNTVVASGDAPITYSLFSGSLPTGSTLYANGVITGTAPVDSSSTTYSFTIEAIDAQLQGSTRSFSLTINVDAVTWVSPANNTTYTSAVDSAISNVALSATDAAGYSVSYSANSLPTGLTLTGSNIAGTPTVIADSSTLLTATAATTNRTAVRTINWSITVAGDPFFEYNTLLIPGASTTFVDDASTNNFAVSIFGDTKPNSFNPYTPGYYSVYSNNTGVLSNVTTTTISAGVFTFEGWFNLTAVTVNTFLMGLGTNTGGTTPYFNVSLTSSGTVINVECYSTSSSAFIFNATYTWPLNRWVHLAAVGNGTTVKVYVNGVGLTTTLGSGTFPGSYLNTLSLYSFVGGLLFGSGGARSDGVNGYVSNFRFVNGTAVYTADFTPSTTPLTAISGTAMLACQSNRLINSNNVSLTTAGVLTINSSQPFTPNSSYSTYGSGYFDGTGDYLTVPYNSALNLGSDTTWTMEYWVYFNAAFGTYTPISFVQSSLLRWNMEHAASTTLLLFNNSTGVTFTNPSTLTPSNWYHIAWVRNGTTVRMYINGVASSTTSTNNLQTISSGPLSIGYNALGGYEFYMNGYISNVRLVKGVAVYTGAFTPPTSPLQATQSAGTNIAAITGTSTSLLTLQNNQSVNNNIFLDNSTNNFFVTRNGNTTQGTFSPYGGNWSINFPASQVYSALSPASTKFNLIGDFTLEAYVFATVRVGGTWGILDARVSGGTAAPWLYGIDGTGKLTFYDGSAKNGATIITLNTWHHVAWVRNGSVLRGYLDGVLDYYNGAYGSGAVSPGSTAPYVGTKDYAINSDYGTPGYLSDLRVVIGTAVYTTSSTTVGATIFTPSTTPLTAVTNTVVLTCQSQRFVDNSLNNFTVTPSSTTISVQRFSPFNPSSLTATSYSGYFDGNADYLSVPSSSAAALGTTYTIECYIYRTGTASSGSYTSVMQLINTQPYGSSVTGFMLTFDGGNVFNFRDSSSAVIVSTADTNLPLNTWIHVAIVRNGSGSNNVTMYLNGVSIVTGTSSGTQATNQAMYIGGDSNGNCSFPGYISNLRIVKGVAVYTGAFTVPTTPLQATQSSGTNIAAITGTATSLLTCQSTAFIDNSTNNFAITAFGNSQPTIQNPFGYTSATTQGYTVSTIGGSGYFDGTGDYLTAPSSTAFAFGSGDFTIEVWIYPTLLSDYRTIFATDGSNSSGICLSFGAAGTPYIYYGAFYYGTAGSIRLNTWQHIAAVRRSGSLVIYVNGVGSTGQTLTSTNASTNPWIGGNPSAAASQLFYGYISNLRINKGTALYTSNFVPSSAPLTAIQNTVLLTNMTGAGIYDAAMMTTMETVGDAKLSTAVSKFGGSSMSFDGTGDWLKLRVNDPTLTFGSGDFTIEGWVYLTSTSGSQYFVVGTCDNATVAGSSFDFGVIGPVGASIYIGASTYTAAAPAPTLNTWCHVAYVRYGTSFKTYLNGTQVGSTTLPAGGVINTGTTNPGAIGANGAGLGPIVGYIDDLRITKGYARYTTTFTPPTTAFPIY